MTLSSQSVRIVESFSYYGDSWALQKRTTITHSAAVVIYCTSYWAASVTMATTATRRNGTNPAIIKAYTTQIHPICQPQVSHHTGDSAWVHHRGRSTRASKCESLALIIALHAKGPTSVCHRCSTNGFNCVAISVCATSRLPLSLDLHCIGV